MTGHTDISISNDVFKKTQEAVELLKHVDRIEFQILVPSPKRLGWRLADRCHWEVGAEDKFEIRCSASNRNSLAKYLPFK